MSSTLVKSVRSRFGSFISTIENSNTHSAKGAGLTADRFVDHELEMLQEAVRSGQYPDQEGFHDNVVWSAGRGKVIAVIRRTNDDRFQVTRFDTEDGVPIVSMR